MLPLTIVLAAGCSDDPLGSISGEASLGCGFFEDPNNCWYKAVSEAYACAGAGDAGSVTGKLAADAKACAYPNGDTDAYDPALQASGGSDAFGITATRGGASCYRFVVTKTGEKSHAELATTSGIVKLDYDSTSYAITCPDAKKLEASGPSFYASTACNTPPPGAVPGSGDVGKAIPGWSIPRTPNADFDMFPHPAGTSSLARCGP